jgi:cytochrome c oxidase subunit 2
MPQSLLAWLPVPASAYAGRVDTLLLLVTAITGTVTLGVLVVMGFFALRYRKGSSARRAPRSDAAHLRRARRRVEIAWTAVPLLIFLAFGAAGARLYFEHYAPPPGAIPIYVVGKQWVWQLEHDNGKREINELHVPRGQPVRLLMASQDVIHSFFLPALRIKQDVLPGRYTQLWFEASTAGEYRLFCAELCGTAHSHMIGRLVVMEPAAFSAWLARGAPPQSMAQRGAALFRSYGCSGCHGERSAVHAPSLAGLYGRPVPLAGGAMVIADERYLRDSILQPRRETAAGYAPIMPSFAGRIGEEELLDLLAYIRSLGDEARADR